MTARFFQVALMQRAKNFSPITSLLVLGWAMMTFAAERLDPFKLLIYSDENNARAPVTSPKQWEKRRAQTAAAFQEVAGPFPAPEKRIPIKVEENEVIDCGSYIRKLITYTPEPKSITPAYLLIPKRALDGGSGWPAVLALHPTDNKLGHKVVIGMSTAPNRDYAHELAERGFVVMAPAYPLLANYQPDWRALGYESGTMKAIWDNVRALDYLDSLPFVRRGAFGAIGHSLGGHNAIYTAFFDDRIKVVVSSCGFDSFSDYMNGNIAGWTSDRYMPKLKNYPSDKVPFDFPELIAGLAPRVCFVNAPFYDDNFKWRSVYRIQQAANEIYSLYGKPQNLIVVHPKCAHDFPKEVRAQAYEILAKNLAP